jgi:hypothetical protein
MKLHWLPGKHRVLFKILLIVYKALHGLAPKYIRDLLTRKQDCCYSLRSDMQGLLEVPYACGKTSGDRAFVRAGHFLWNSLPLDIRASSSVDCFKRHLITFLFRDAYISSVFHIDIQL